VTQSLDTRPPGPDTFPGPPHSLPFGLLKELGQPRDMFRDIGPNWYASIMGTGIVAIAGANLPVHVRGLREFATAVWLLSAAALVALTAAWAVHWIRYPDRAPRSSSTGCSWPPG
jgi:Voltage-dependent anion channel